MRLPAFIIAGLIAAIAPVLAVDRQQPAALTDEQVAAAIKAGQSKKTKDHVSSCAATAGFGARLAAGQGVQPLGSIFVSVSTNFGRIAALAENAKRLYQPFGVADVSEQVRGVPTVFVHAEPADPDHDNGRIEIAPRIERIVLKSKTDESAVLQPTSLESEPVEWKNLVGGSVSSNRVTATFSLTDFMVLPRGDIDIVLITVEGERRCKIGAGDQKKIFGRG